MRENTHIENPLRKFDVVMGEKLEQVILL